MPGFDKRGPMGAGPMTGSAKALCYPADKEFNPGFMRGYGNVRGLGLRRGFRGGFNPSVRRGYGRCYRWYPSAFDPAYPVDTAEEMEMLKAEADYMKQSLDAINKRIDELEKKPAAES